MDLIIIPMLQKLGFRIPDVYMGGLWNPGGLPINIEKKHYHQLYKRIRLYGKNGPWPTRKCRCYD